MAEQAMPPKGGPASALTAGPTRLESFVHSLLEKGFSVKNIEYIGAADSAKYAILRKDVDKSKDDESILDQPISDMDNLANEVDVNDSYTLCYVDLTPTGHDREYVDSMTLNSQMPRVRLFYLTIELADQIKEASADAEVFNKIKSN